MRALTLVDKKLFQAVENGDITLAKQAIGEGANLEAIRKYRTPLLDACIRGDIAMVSMLVEQGAAIAMVKGCREPIGTVMWKGDKKLLAAMLQVDDSPTSLALALMNGLKNNNFQYSTSDIWRSLMTTKWHCVFISLIDQELLFLQETRIWMWKLVADVGNPCEATIEKLHQAAPITESIQREDMLRSIIEGLPSMSLLRLLARVGWLTSAELFDLPLSSNDKGLLMPLIKRYHCPMPILRWLLTYASTQDEGKEKLIAAQGDLLPLCLGHRASWPLAKLFCKLTNTDLIQTCITAIDKSGRDVLHALFIPTSEINRRMEIGRILLQAGMDPMRMDTNNIPACYGAIFYQPIIEKSLDLMDEFGADLTLHGPVGQALDRDASQHIRWRNNAAEALLAFSIKKAHRHLQSTTPAITQQSGVRRI